MAIEAFVSSACFSKSPSSAGLGFHLCPVPAVPLPCALKLHIVRLVGSFSFLNLSEYRKTQILFGGISILFTEYLFLQVIT